MIAATTIEIEGKSAVSSVRKITLFTTEFEVSRPVFDLRRQVITDMDLNMAGGELYEVLASASDHEIKDYLKVIMAVEVQEAR